VATLRKNVNKINKTTAEKNKFQRANQYPRLTPVVAMINKKMPKPISRIMGLARISRMANLIGSSNALISMLHNIA
jgi:hypothetical protein